MTEPTKASAGQADLKGDFDRLRVDFDRLVKDVSEALQSGRDAALRSGAEAVSVAREQLDVVGDDLSRRVRDNPLTACAVAAGVGMVLGLLIGSRK